MSKKKKKGKRKLSRKEKFLLTLAIIDLLARVIELLNNLFK